MNETAQEEKRSRGSSVTRDYARVLVTAIASFFLALTFPGFATALRGISQEEATGLPVLAVGLLQSAFSPWFWIFFLLFFSWLYFASASSKSWIRLFLFWIPALLVCFLGLGFWAGIVYLASRAQVH